MSTNTRIAIALFGLFALAVTTPAKALVTTSTFSDPSGLDLTGAIVVAEDTGGPGVTVSGVTFTTPSHFITGNNVSTSPGLADPNLNALMTTWSFQGPPFTGTMSDAISLPSGLYKLQLLFNDQAASSRGNWDLTAEGQTLLNFNATTTSTPTVITFNNLLVTDGALNVSISHNPSTPSGDYETLAAFTVEALPEPASLSLLGMGSLVALRRTRRSRVA